MLFALPMELARSGSAVCGGIYIYAAATLPQYRRRGIMSRLIGAACSRVDFAALLPAGDSLYGYYSALGFAELHPLRRAGLTRTELMRLSAGAGPGSNFIKKDTKNISAENMLALRRSLFPDSLRWGGDMLSYAVDELLYTGGVLLSSCKGYMLYTIDGDTAHIKELCVPPGEYARASAAVLKETECEKFIIDTAADNDFFGGEIIRYGMLKYLSDNISMIGREALDRLYFNLLLD
jgi:hypothetical protein